MRVERGGRAIVAIFLGAWIVVWAIVMIAAEVNVFAYAVGVPILLVALAGWVFQRPKSGKALIAAVVGLLFVTEAFVILARVSLMAFVVVTPLVIALLVAWVLEKPAGADADLQAGSIDSAGE
jgi:hypothetical protein